MTTPIDELAPASSQMTPDQMLEVKTLQRSLIIEVSRSWMRSGDLNIVCEGIARALGEFFRISAPENSDRDELIVELATAVAGWAYEDQAPLTDNDNAAITRNLLAHGHRSNIPPSTMPARGAA